MTIDTLGRPTDTAAADKGDRRSRGKATSNGRGDSAAIVLGASPRADFMPPEIHLKRAQLRTRRGLRVGLFFVVVVTIAGCIGAWTLQVVAQAQLAIAQDQVQALAAEQETYVQVRDVQDTVKLIEAGQQVGASTEIDWKAYLIDLQATLPRGVVLDTVTIDSATPLAEFTQSTTPLQGERVASLSFTATSPTLPDVPKWLDGLATLKGFVDAVPGSVSLDEDVYRVNVLMHINSDAFLKRFAVGTDSQNGN